MPKSGVDFPLVVLVVLFILATCSDESTCGGTCRLKIEPQHSEVDVHFRGSPRDKDSEGDPFHMSNTTTNSRSSERGLTSSIPAAPGSALEMTREAQRIIDQMFIRVARMSTEDKEVLILSLRHTIRELELATQQVQQGKVPKELNCIPGSLALLSMLTLMMPENKDIQQRFTGFVDEITKARRL